MSTLSLDLRGVGPTRALPPDTPAKGAGVSLLLHSVGISTLVLIPLLQSTNPPEVVRAIATPLLRPITVILPPARPRVSVAPRRLSRPPSATAAIPDLTPPADLPTSLDTGHVLDFGPGPISDAQPSDRDDPTSSLVGACPLGSVCGTGVVPIAGPPRPPVRIGGVIKEPRLIEGRAPLYPPIAQAAGVTGRVVLEAHVGPDGRVREVRITEGGTLFDEAALASVRSRRYEPLLLNGIPTDFLLTITVTFNSRR